MDDQRGIVDFFRRRDQWQGEQTRIFNRLLNRLCCYAERETNLREKVRARHVFSTITGDDSFPEKNPQWEDWFQLWYALDYLNIRGYRHLDGYLHKYRTDLTDKELRMIASLMTSYLSVFRLQIDEESGCFMAREFFRGQDAGDLVLGLNGLEEGSPLYLLRPVKVGVYHVPAGPAAPVTRKQAKAMNEWLESMYQAEWRQRTDESFSWRVFMQHWGVGLIHWLDRVHGEKEQKGR